MTVAKDLTGQKFTRLLVVERDSVSSGGNMIWQCVCDCGVRVSVRAGNLVSGNTKSCGCLKKEFASSAFKTHGLTVGGNKSAEYKVWQGIRRRCNNRNDATFRNYGAKGITISKEWDSFETFINDMGVRPSSLHSIERINNGLGYNKDNCKWATKKEQARNTSSNRNITIDGKFYSTLTEAVEVYRLNCEMIKKRLLIGWDVEDAFKLPPGTRNPKRLCRHQSL